MNALRFSLVVLCSLLAPAAASAHNMIVINDVLPDQVRVEAKFDDDSRAGEAEVILLDAAGTEITHGKMDGKGVFVFPRPKPGSYTVRVKHSGHVQEVPLPIPDESFLGQFASRQPDKLFGALVGVGLLLGIALFFRMRQRSKPSVA